VRLPLQIAAWLMVSAQLGGGQPSLARLQIPDTELVNQNGQQVQFVSDVVKERIAVIDTVFTTCTTICPMMGVNYGRLAKILKERLGREVVMVSVSIDPENDTPARLKEWSAKFYAGPGWVLLTGPKSRVDTFLKSLGLYTPERLNHQSTILIGNTSGGWIRTSALSSPDKWMKMIDGLEAQTRTAKQ
jgi:protein SCO1/2